jgi:hypothetical protein
LWKKPKKKLRISKKGPGAPKLHLPKSFFPDLKNRGSSLKVSTHPIKKSGCHFEKSSVENQHFPNLFVEFLTPELSKIKNFLLIYSRG